jgi:hypothetical protein
MVFAGQAASIRAASTSLPHEAGHRRIARLDVPFVENRGQLDSRVAFSARTFFGRVFVTRDGRLVYSLASSGASPRKTAGARNHTGWSFTETLVSGSPRPTAGFRAASAVSDFRGSDPTCWRSDLPTYDEVRLGEVWQGVLVSLRTRAGNVEKIFTLEPGATVERIRVRVSGARSLRVDSSGALVATTPDGELRFTSPYAYQKQRGERSVVSVSYVVTGELYGFRLGRFDPTLPVVIDPLLQSTYLGGSDGDIPYSIAVHPSTGEVLVAGGTASVDFPGTDGGARPALDGAYDAFVARFDPALSTLIQATYLGGSDFDELRAVAFDTTTGDVIVGGMTSSTDLPATIGAFQQTIAGDLESGYLDGFVARLDQNLTTLRQATYLGGANGEFIDSMVVDPANGEVLVAGTTTSTDFPGTSGGAQPIHGGGYYDAFVARFDGSLTSLVRSSYLGGEALDEAFEVALHRSNGEILVIGNTESDSFPGTDGGARPTPIPFDGFVARLRADLTSVLQSTYVGSSPVYGIAVQPESGEILVAGSAGIDLPGTAGGAQPAHGGGRGDCFVSKYGSTLTSLIQSTFFGGTGSEICYDIAIHPSRGEVLVSGSSDSTDLPRTNDGAQPFFGGGSQYEGEGDGFVARLNPELTNLLQATYLGGSEHESVRIVAVNPQSEEVLVAGRGYSTDFPATTGGAQPMYGGSVWPGDGFLSRLTPELAGGGAIAHSIAVDRAATPSSRPGTSDDNGVLEPDENAIVSPTWTNGIGAPVSVSATAASLRGGVEAHYEIEDASANYGSIAAGDSKSCSTTGDCYSVSVSDVTSRPTHFDTKFTETLSTGDFRFWTLHIGDSFADVSRSHLFYEKIETLLHAGITSGCTPRTYCPSDAVSRSQMAIFVAKAVAGSGSRIPDSGSIDGRDYECHYGIGTSLFADVAPGDIFCKHVHYLGIQNITLGCSAWNYCPHPFVTRGEMAVFIARAMVAPGGGSAVPASYGPDPATGLSYSCEAGSPNLHFADVFVSDSFCKHVHFLWAKGIISGCSATEYCPADQVSRGAMAKFLGNAFNLQLYGP